MYFNKQQNLLYFTQTIRIFDRNISTGVFKITCDDCSQCNIGEQKIQIAELLFYKTHLTFDGKKSLFDLSIFKL